MRENKIKRLPVIQAIIWLQLFLLIFGLVPFRIVAHQPIADPDVTRNQFLRGRRTHLPPAAPASITIRNDKYKLVFSAVGLSITLLHLLLISGSNILIIQSGFDDRHSAQFSVIPTSRLAVIQRRTVSTLVIFSTFHSLIQTLMSGKQKMRRLNLLVRLDCVFSSAGIDTVPFYRKLYWKSLISSLGLIVLLATLIYHQIFFYLNGEHHQFNAISMFVICWLYVMPIIYKQVQAYICLVYINQIRIHFELMNRKLLERVLIEESKHQSKNSWFEEE